jgi:hypothetical protein
MSTGPLPRLARRAYTGGMRPLALALLLALVACGERSDPPLHRASAQERREAMEESLGRTPQPRSYRYADGELRVFEVPVRSGRFVDRQTCILWRDAEFKTATLQCPSETESLTIPGGAEREQGY